MILALTFLSLIQLGGKYETPPGFNLMIFTLSYNYEIPPGFLSSQLSTLNVQLSFHFIQRDVAEFIPPEAGLHFNS